jgi:Uma2 family endonuclease
MPQIPEGHRFEVVPDWICEVLSPSTESKDRRVKMPIYAHYGVAYAWLVDPKQRSLEAYALDSGEWCQLAEATGNDAVAIAPFDALTLDLSNLWG